jgi:hypothetical protein
MARRLKIVAVAAALLVSAGVARADTAWSSEADIGVTVNGHSFHHARIDGSGCTVSVRLAFDAPEKGYSDPKNVVRNYHRFRARVRMAKGQIAASKIFGNSGAGERTYSFEDDTSGAGCWSKEPGKLVKVDVIGCRGRGCDVGSFD